MGRGLQPTSTILNTFVGFTGGDAFTTYTSVPHFVSKYGPSVYLRNHEISWFDFRAHEAGILSIHVRFSDEKRKVMRGGLISKRNGGYLGIVEAYTREFGRMASLPKWTDNGIMVGIQGGEQRVLEILEELQSAGIPVAGVWLQDWCGRRLQTILGQAQYRLWWNVHLTN